MNVNNLFPEEPREQCPRFGSHANSGTVTVLPIPGDGPAWLDTVGRVEYQNNWKDKHRPYGIGWWQRVQWYATWWRRWALGPLFGGPAEYLSDRLNLINSDTAFNIVSANGNKVRLAALSSSFDARKWVVGTRIVQNSLWFPGSEYTRYLFRPYYGSAQLGDEVIFHPNSVLFNKCRPLIIDIERAEGDQDWDNYLPGDDFVIVLDMDATHAKTPVNEDDDLPNSLWIRTHTLEPAAWKPLLENRPFYASSMRKRYSRAQIDAAPNGVIELLNQTNQSCRIARPINSTHNRIADLFKVTIYDSNANKDGTDITNLFLADSRLAVTHEPDNKYKTRVWLGNRNQAGITDHIVPEGGSVEIIYWPEDLKPDLQKSVAVCQSRCHYSRIDNAGRAYCAKAFDGFMNEETETWVETPPSGLANFRAECYQWSSGNIGSAGCDSFVDREPTGLDEWDDFWVQLWCDTGIRMSQYLVGFPLVYIERLGVEGLLQLGGARLDREIELGVERKTLVQTTRIGYLDLDDKEFVQGLCNTYMAAVGANALQPLTWGKPSLLKKRNVDTGNYTKNTIEGIVDASAITNIIGDPYRSYPLIPAVKAESNMKLGRSVKDALLRSVVSYEVIPNIRHSKDGNTSVLPLGWRYVSTASPDEILLYNELYTNPYSVYENPAIVSGTIAGVAINNSSTEVDKLYIGILNTWRTVTLLNVDGDPVTGTIQCNGTFVRYHAMFELVNDPGHGDGFNPGRGCIPGDCVFFTRTDGPPISSKLENRLLVVAEAAPTLYGGFYINPGWNYDPNAEPPLGLFIPDMFLGSDYSTGLVSGRNYEDGWGVQLGWVVCYVKKGSVSQEELNTIVGNQITACQLGSQYDPLSMPFLKSEYTTSKHNKRDYDVDYEYVKDENSATGSFILDGQKITAKHGSEAFDLRLLTTRYDRRRGIRAQDQNLIPKVFEVMDTIRIVPTGNIEGLIGWAYHEENLCQANDWGYWGPGGVWVSNSFNSHLTPSSLPDTPKVFQGFDKIGDRYTGASVTIQAPGFGIGPTALSTLPDGTQIASARVKFKTGSLFYQETVDELVKGSTTPIRTVTQSTTEAPISGALYARRPDGTYMIIGSSLSIQSQVDEWGLLDITSLVQNYLDSWRKSEYTDFGIILIPPGFYDWPLPKKEYSSYAPQAVNCNLPSNNNQFGSTTFGPNPTYVDDRAFKIKYHYLEYGSVNFDSIIVEIASLPSGISGRSLVNTRLITNEHANYRRTWPWKQP